MPPSYANGKRTKAHTTCTVNPIKSSAVPKKNFSWMHHQFPVEFLTAKLLELAQEAREALDARELYCSAEVGSTKPTDIESERSKGEGDLSHSTR